MKKSSYILGIISICIILVATIFKAMHLAGAGILLTLGIGFLSFIFLPVTYTYLLKSTSDKFLKWVYLAAFLSFFVDFIGMLFKIMHWPGAAKLMIIGVPLPFVLFLPIYILYHNKRKLKTDINFFGILLFMIYLGVYSSLLSVNVSREYIFSFANTTEAIEKSNYLLREQIPAQSKTLELIDQLDEIKVKIAVIANDENRTLIVDGKLIAYEPLYVKDRRLSYQEIESSGLSKFNASFEVFKTEILKSGSTTNTRLITEIDAYRLPNDYSETPIIGKMILINFINTLTDWQNKILLIEYNRQYSSCI